MEKSRKNQETRIRIDLPAQNVWKELQEYLIDTPEGRNEATRNNSKGIEYLLDRSFELLLEKLARQN